MILVAFDMCLDDRAARRGLEEESYHPNVQKKLRAAKSRRGEDVCL